MSNASKLDQKEWNEFYADWPDSAYKREQLLAHKQPITLEVVASKYDPLPLAAGKVKEQLVKMRVIQQFFRKTVMTAYDNTCCVTGLHQSALLASVNSRWYVLGWTTC
jgi:putative restriction endonuclease